MNDRKKERKKERTEGRKEGRKEERGRSENGNKGKEWIRKKASKIHEMKNNSLVHIWMIIPGKLSIS